jgi:hypothetical protein
MGKFELQDKARIRNITPTGMPVLKTSKLLNTFKLNPPIPLPTCGRVHRAWLFG